jgi:DNA (cytosine-5)-methyltransferase 1
MRIVAELDSKTFVFENVKGLTIGRHKDFLRELVAAFNGAGYDVRLPWRVLDAAYYGVPQHRERLILIGAKRGLPLPDYPAFQTNPADLHKRLPGLPPGPTCRDAIGDLPDADAFECLIQSDTAPLPSASHRRPATHYGYPRQSDPRVLTSSARTIHTEISRRRFAETQPGEIEPISRFFRLAPDGLSNTLRAGTDGARGAFTSPRPIHYLYPRCITVREMARLHGYPDWFRFHATKWHGARQIGNSVPPPLGRAIAADIFKSLGLEPELPAAELALGDPALLYMEMSQAAAHFGVKAPGTRRDRKSGAKKRKQHEIEAARSKSAPPETLAQGLLNVR